MSDGEDKEAADIIVVDARPHGIISHGIIANYIDDPDARPISCDVCHVRLTPYHIEHHSEPEKDTYWCVVCGRKFLYLSEKTEDGRDWTELG